METIVKYNDAKGFDKVIPISSLKGINMNNLIEEIIKDLPEDDIKYYDENSSTEMSDTFYVSEIVREKALFNLNDEVPHQLFVKTEEDEDSTEHMRRFRSEIIVNRDTLKGIIIGKGGTMIKKIGMQARHDLEKYFGSKVFLELFVKVRKD
jgi:GTP-binding protein Era